MISVSQLDKTFGVKYALRGINLQVAGGEIVTLVGPNGAGKTTLLRILATLARPTRGKVEINGYPMPEHATTARHFIGFVGHQTLLYDDLTARENLQFYARLFGVENQSARIVEVAQRVGIEKRLDDVVRTLSRGLQQRVALARALLHRPAVFLYDEPYTGLDQNSATILDEILRAAGESGAAVFFASHDFERALGVCDRALILASGKIVYEGARGDWGTLEGFRQIYTAQVAT